MSAVPDWRQTGDDYQTVAHSTSVTVEHLIRRIHAMEYRRSGRTDAGPIVAGTVSAIIDFVADTQMPFAELREKMLQVFDAVAPQIEIERAARRSGASASSGVVQ